MDTDLTDIVRGYKPMEEPKLLKSKKPGPDTQSWHEYIRKAEQETANRLEDAAKFLAVMVSVSLTLFLAIGKSSFEKYQDCLSIKVAVILWIGSLLFAFFVLFPCRYKYVSQSAQSIKDMSRRIARVKYWLLFASLVLYSGALGILAAVFFL